MHTTSRQGNPPSTLRSTSRSAANQTSYSGISHTVVALVTVLAAWLIAPSARADVVLLLPATGQVPGKAITGVLARESRYAVLEAKHTLVSDLDTDAAIRSVEDGHPDSPDEYSQMAEATHADWVLVPRILPFPPGYGLELTAYQDNSGRTETVVREIATNKIHDQVLEMVELLLSDKGIGTAPLPWEQPPQDTSTKTPQSTKTTGTAGDITSSGLIVGLGGGAGVCVSRACSGSSATLVGELSLGWRFGEALSLQTNVHGYIQDGSSLQVEMGARYLIPITANGSLSAGGEVGVGVVVDPSSLLTVRAAPVVDYEVTQSVHVQATLGDTTWIEPTDGNLMTGGTLRGVLTF